MKITLLGSGNAMGMPVPMCNCEYCQASDKRRRPRVLVETQDATVVLEISPDIKEQLQTTDTYDVDAFFVTHYHFDHSTGIRELNHIAINEHVLNEEDFDYNSWHVRNIKLFGNQRTEDLLKEFPHIYENENIDYQVFQPDESIKIGDLVIRPFDVEHGVSTQGYVVETDGSKFVYAPDARNIPDRNSTVYADADIALLEGTVFDAESHGYRHEIMNNIHQVDARRTVLVNVSEHLNQMHTEKIERMAQDMGYEIWDDFDSEIV